MPLQTETEKKILRAAEEVLLEKGYSATTTQDIARKAKCNQSLVYYYYRSKENLFLMIFKEKTELIFNSFAEPLQVDHDIIETVQHMVDAYFDFLSQNERLPYFLVNEIIQNPNIQEYIIEIFEQNAVRMSVFMKFDVRVREGVRAGIIRDIDSADLMIHIVSLCVSTFLSKNMLLHVLSFSDGLDGEFLTHRKQGIKKLIIHGITAQNEEL